jgi:hypothetical protein
MVVMYKPSRAPMNSTSESVNPMFLTQSASR